MNKANRQRGDSQSTAREPLEKQQLKIQRYGIQTCLRATGMLVACALTCDCLRNANTPLLVPVKQLRCNPPRFPCSIFENKGLRPWITHGLVPLPLIQM